MDVTHRLSSTDSITLGIDSFGKPNLKEKRERENHLTFNLKMCWIDTALAGKRKRGRRKKKKTPLAGVVAVIIRRALKAELEE